MSSRSPGPPRSPGPRTTFPVSRPFDNAYLGLPSWETGRIQPAVGLLEAEGVLGSSLLDAGCGTGLHAVHLARHARLVTGVDVARRAIELARQRARREHAAASFAVADVLDPAGLAWLPGAPFETVLDVGLFHVLQPDAREAYAAALATVTRPGGAAFVVAWSDRNPFGIGPSRVSRRDLRAAFQARTGWRVEAIDGSRLETRLPMGEVHAWLARIRRR